MSNVNGIELFADGGLTEVACLRQLAPSLERQFSHRNSSRPTTNGGQARRENA